MISARVGTWTERCCPVGARAKPMPAFRPRGAAGTRDGGTGGRPVSPGPGGPVELVEEAVLGRRADARREGRPGPRRGGVALPVVSPRVVLRVLVRRGGLRRGRGVVPAPIV